MVNAAARANLSRACDLARERCRHGRPVKHLALPVQANAAEEDEPEDETTAAFRRAAAALKEKREEEAMCVEDRIYKCA